MLRIFKISAAALATAFLTGCSAASLLNTITPSASFNRDRDIPYGDLSRQTMDIYRASQPRIGAPVILFVHGGGWNSGDKKLYKFLAEGFTKDGFDVAVPNYRLHPESQYPDMVVDAGLAIQAVAAEFMDRPIVLMGHSAGAYNVLMAVMAPSVSGANVCENVSGVVSLAAPTGAYPLTDEPYITIFPDRFQADDAPMNLSSNGLPPIFLMNGQEDETVGPENASALADHLLSQGHGVELKLYPDMNHIDPVRVLSRHFDGDSSLKSDILTFIDGLAVPSTEDFCEAA